MLPPFRPASFFVFGSALLVGVLLGDRAPMALLAAGEQGGPWSIFTAPLSPRDPQLWTLWPTLFVQWFLGARLEGYWTKLRYFALVYGCSVLGYALCVWVLPLAGGPADWSGSLSGPAALNAATVVAYIAVFWGHQHPLFGRDFPVPAVGGVLGALVLLSAWYGAAVRPSWVALVPCAAAALLALLAVSPRWRRAGSSGTVGGRKTRDRSHLRVVHSAEDLLN